MAIYTPQDVGGFGRLADVGFKKRAEKREERRLTLAERSAGLRDELTGLQIKQTQSNLEQAMKTSKIKAGLAESMKDIPEGENQFSHAYKYLMGQGEQELASKYMKSQSARIEQIYKMDPERGIAVFNDTIGKTMGTTLEFHEDDKKYGPIHKAVDNETGKEVFIRKVDGGFEQVPGYSPLKPLSKKTGYQLKDKNLQVINAIATKIKRGTSTPEELQTYKLAESDYTQPKRFTDPVTKESVLMQPSLPKGLPTFKPKESEAIKQPQGHEEPLLSTGEFTITPVSDPEKLTKSEIVTYRKTADSLYIMRDMLTALKDDIEANGLQTLNVRTIADRKSKYADILMRYKEVLNLGVLNGPDIEQMQRIIKDPVTLGTYSLGKDWVIPGYDNVLESLERELNNMYNKSGGVVGESAEKVQGKPMTADDYLKKFRK